MHEKSFDAVRGSFSFMLNSAAHSPYALIPSYSSSGPCLPFAVLFLSFPLSGMCCSFPSFFVAFLPNRSQEIYVSSTCRSSSVPFSNVCYMLSSVHSWVSRNVKAGKKEPIIAFSLHRCSFNTSLPVNGRMMFVSCIS